MSTWKRKTCALKNPAGATWLIGDLDDTVYRGKHSVVDGWGKFYLPEIVSMQVVGVVEGTSFPCDQLVLMTCEDGKMYAYDGEELHLVASSLEQLFESGIEYPASKSYYNGEAFKDMVRRSCWQQISLCFFGIYSLLSFIIFITCSLLFLPFFVIYLGYVSLWSLTSWKMINHLWVLTAPFFLFLALSVACRLRKTGIKWGRVPWGRVWTRRIINWWQQKSPNFWSSSNPPLVGIFTFATGWRSRCA